MRSDDPRDLLELTRLKSLAEVERLADRFIRRAGFSNYVYAFANPGDWREVGWSALIDGYGRPWIDRYVAGNYAGVDPIPEYCFATSQIRPMVWRPAIYNTPARRAFAEDALGYGVGAGLSCPLSTATGRRGALCLSLNGNGTDAHEFAERSQSWSLLLATYVHDAFQRLSPAPETTGALPLTGPPDLTARERACLERYAAGDAITLTARRLGISESRVRQLRHSLCLKFGLPNLRQVLVRAIALRMVHPG